MKSVKSPRAARRGGGAVEAKRETVAEVVAVAEEDMPRVLVLRDLADIGADEGSEEYDAWNAAEEVDFGEMEDLLTRFLADARVSEAMRSGESLRGLNERVHLELGASMESALESYVARAESFAELHHEILSCDTILKRMEDMLTVFKVDLQVISNDIRSLQVESSSMNVRLKNRKDVETRLAAFLDDLCLPPALVTHLLNATEIDAEYLEDLVILHRKIKTVNKVIKYHARAAGAMASPSPAGAAVPAAAADSAAVAASAAAATPRAIRDAGPMLLKLRNKCSATIRATLLSDKGFHSLLKPLSNAGMYQQTVLLKLRPAYQFLLHHSKDVANEVRNYYISAMSERYAGVFKTYLADTSKLLVSPFEKHDLIGIAEGAAPAAAAGWGSWLGLGGKDAAAATTSAAASAAGGKGKDAAARSVARFALGDRRALVDDLGAPAIVAHAAAGDKTVYSAAQLFRSYQLMFADAVSGEVQFCRDFFSMDLFEPVFGRSSTLLITQVRSAVSSSFDIVGLFLMMHITYRFKVMMDVTREIKLDALQTYYNGCLDVIRDRIVAVLGLHVKSVDAAALTKQAAGVKVDVARACVAAASFGELAASYRALAVGMHEPVVDEQLSVLAQATLEGVRGYAATAVADESVRAVYLLNSFGAALAALQTGPGARPAADGGAVSAASPPASLELAAFQNAVDMLLQRKVSAVLRLRFASLLSFVARAKDARSGAGGPIASIEVADTVRQFADHWKSNLHDMRSDLAALSPVLARLVLKDAFAQVTILYDSLEDYVRAYAKDQTPNLTSKTTLSYEIGKIIREI